MVKTVTVVGAGVIGAAISFYLARAGARVTVIDAATPASGASGRSFGWINASFFASQDHFRLRMAAMAAHHALTTDLGPTGALWPGAVSWEQSGDALEATATTLTQMDYPLRRISRTEFGRLEPAIAAPPSEALYFPTEGIVDLAGLTRRLLAGAARHGARLCCGVPVTEIRAKGSVATDQGAIEADQVVLAGGTGSAALMARLGLRLPMLTRPALMLRSRPVAPLIRHILVTPDHELRQDPSGRLVAPTSAGHQQDDRDKVSELPMTIADRALANLQALLPQTDLAWEEVTLAFRPVPGDGLPAVGETGVEGLYLAVMHSGATLAPLIGQLVAAEVMGGTASPLLAPYRPARFA
jgi:D-hydroxyproline dehydrogenase subunit beta